MRTKSKKFSLFLFLLDDSPHVLKPCTHVEHGCDQINSNVISSILLIPTTPRTPAGCYDAKGLVNCVRNGKFNFLELSFGQFFFIDLILMTLSVS